MKTMARAVATALAVLTTSALATGSASASDTFPENSIRVVVPFGAGGATNFVARAITQIMSANSGWDIVVENRPGGGGNIGSAEVARAASDGYTWLVATAGIMAANEHMYANLPFDPGADFEPIGVIGTIPNILVVSPLLDVANVEELIALSRSGRGLTFSSSGDGTSSHLASELLAEKTGANFIHVPYSDAGQGHIDLLAGRIDFTINNLPGMLDFIRDGQLRGLAITSTERSELLPDIPTMQEEGVEGYSLTTWFGIVVPSGTDAAIREAIAEQMRLALAGDELSALFETQGVNPGTVFLDEFGALIEDERVTWAAVIEAAGIALD